MASRETGVAPARQPRIVARTRHLEPSYEEIAVRAYEIFLTRGGAHGDDLQDWLQAERELQDEN